MRKGEAEFKGNFKENGAYLEPQLISEKEKEEFNLVKYNQFGEQSHIFFGHGIRKDDVKDFITKKYKKIIKSSQKEISKQRMN